MQIDGALIREQGVTFAIVVVRAYVLSSINECENARQNIGRLFPGVPLILMAQDGRGRPTYQGRKDIVNFLSRIDPSRIPWKRYSFN